MRGRAAGREEKRNTGEHLCPGGGRQGGRAVQKVLGDFIPDRDRTDQLI